MIWKVSLSICIQVHKSKSSLYSGLLIKNSMQLTSTKKASGGHAKGS